MTVGSAEASKLPYRSRSTLFAITFPLVFVVFSMSHDAPDVDLMGLVVDPGDQSVFVIADIKDGADPVNIRSAESFACFREVLPVSVGSDVIPSVQRHLALGV